MRSLSLIFFFISFNALHAQGIFKSDDYAITWQHDTIKGFINEIGERRINIANIQDGQDKIVKLSVKSVKAYLKNDTLYRNVSFSDTIDPANMLFMKVLFDGPLTFLERETEKASLANLKDTKENTALIQKVKEKKYYVHGQSRIAKEINPDNFSIVLMPLTADKERVQKRLSDKYYTFQNIDLLLMDYKYLVENNVE